MWVFFMNGTGINSMEGAGAISLLRMLRLSRICRVARLLQSIPELMVLIKGIRAACPAVSWTLFFLVIVIYVFSVAFRILCRENALGVKYFSSIGQGMSTLLLPGLLPDS